MAEHEVSLREFIEAKFVALEKATDDARSQMEKRLDGMNEFRETLRDQAAKFVTRDELDLHMNKVDAVLKDLQTTRSELKGKAEQQTVTQTTILALLALFLAGLALWMKG
jgi:hypothetical protein